MIGLMVQHRGIARTYFQRCLVPRNSRNASILTIFRCRTDRYLRGILSIYRNETALQIRLCNATKCPWVYHRISLMYFLFQSRFHLSSCSKRFKLTHSSKSHGSSFTRRVYYFSGRNSAESMFSQCHYVSLGLS